MKKSPVSNQNLGNFPSPGAPKGWSSERVAYPTSSSNNNSNSSRRHISATSLTPFYSGRALPSKWEDAERWICSPVSAYGVSKNSSNTQFQRRPKSKSGPIVPPGMNYSSLSPGMRVLEGANVTNFMAVSPFSTGVLVADGLWVNYGGGRHGYLVQNENNAVPSSRIPGWSDLACEESLLSSPDEKLDDIADAETMVSHVPSRRDMGTQMSPDNSNHSSPGGKSFFSSTPPSNLPIVEIQNDHPTKLEVREVQVDKRATMISQSKRHGSRIIKKGVPNVEDFYQNATGTCTPSLDLSEVVTSISKLQREEAKINAWENLQKARAEAAIRKLEMKLERERSKSMDKILNKLKQAQIKAQEMRSSISVKQDQQIPNTSQKVRFFHQHAHRRYFRSCFTFHHT